MFKCKDNCGECCGIVPIPTRVWNKNKENIQRIIKQLHASEVFVFPITEDLICCFLGKNKECLIYEERPDVCIKYGQYKELPCPYLKPNGNEWSVAKAKQIRKQIDKDVDKAIKVAGHKRIGEGVKK